MLDHSLVLVVLVLAAAFIAVFETSDWSRARLFCAETAIALILLFLLLGPSGPPAVLLIAPLAVAAMWISGGRIRIARTWGRRP